MGDMGLGERDAVEQRIVAQRGQRRGQVAHQRTIATIAVLLRPGQRAIADVALDAAPAGVAAIHGLATPPGHKGIGNQLAVEGARLLLAEQERIAQCEAHRGVVRDLTRLQLEPTAAHEVRHHAEAAADRRSRLGR